MKNLIFTVAIVATSLTLFSFTSLENNEGVYDSVSGNVIFKAGKAGSFSEYHSSYSDKDVRPLKNSSQKKP